MDRLRRIIIVFSLFFWLIGLVSGAFQIENVPRALGATDSAQLQSKIDICNSSPACSWVEPNCICKGDATPMPNKKYNWNEVALPSGNSVEKAAPIETQTETVTVYSAPAIEQIIALPEVQDVVKVQKVEKITSAGIREIKISGTGPSNSTIYVYIYSDPIVVTTETDDKGTWSYILSDRLEGGDHKVLASTSTEESIVRSPLHEFTIVPAAEAQSENIDFQIIDKSRSESYVEYLSNAGVLIVIGIAGLALLIKFVSRRNNLQ